MEKKYYVYDALKILIEISKNAQEAFLEEVHHMGEIDYIKEFCTVRLATARRGGHTEAAFKLIEEDGMNIGYFCLNNTMANIFKNRYRQIKKNTNFGNLEFSSSIKNLENNIFGKDLSDLDAIVFDNSFMMSKKLQNNIYSYLSSSLFYNRGRRPFFFIFLQ